MIFRTGRAKFLFNGNLNRCNIEAGTAARVINTNNHDLLVPKQGASALYLESSEKHHCSQCLLEQTGALEGALPRKSSTQHQ